MSKKIIDINEILNNQTEQEPGLCPHCKVKFSLIDDFIEMLQNVIIRSSKEDVSEKVLTLVNDFYDDAYVEGKRSAFENMINFSAYSIDQIDNPEKED